MRVQKRRSFSSIESQVHWQDCIGRRAEAEATCRQRQRPPAYACAEEEVLLFN